MVEVIGCILCIKIGEEIGVLYQLDNGEMQVVLYDDCYFKILYCLDYFVELDFGVECSQWMDGVQIQYVLRVG